LAESKAQNKDFRRQLGEGKVEREALKMRCEQLEGEYTVNRRKFAKRQKKLERRADTLRRGRVGEGSSAGD
jgi:hypothetical protein